ncbi:MAG: endopeptidase La [Lentisphaerae bacterium]|nr:endopeptidase La [Lentisphaerota bacterium]
MLNPKEHSPAISVDGGFESTAYMLRLREPVVFPRLLASLSIDDPSGIASLNAAAKGDRLVAIFNAAPTYTELKRADLHGSLPHFDDNGQPRCAVGTLARIIKELNMPDGSRKVVVRGLKRIAGVSLILEKGGETSIRYRALPESGSDNSISVQSKLKMLKRMFGELSMMQPGIPEDVQENVQNSQSSTLCMDQIADSFATISYTEKLMILTAGDIEERMDMMISLVSRELETGRASIQLQMKVQEAMGASQREFFLREQLKAIKQELGEFTGNSDVAELTARLEKTDLPELVADTIKKELERLELLPQNAPEYHINYGYINTLLDIPWQKFSEDRLDCVQAEKILNADHYGLEDVKTRILEFLSVMQRRALNGNCRAPILCLVGPPGVGKTSIGRSIARAMNRNFIRVSFGGVRDEAEIRGHRRTYVGAMPGRIVQNLKRAGSANPVFMLDEIDKLAHDFRGDPASALLEVLDPEQNNAFNDNFVELPLDLSKVFFIATANVLEDIPGPLRDRMEVIRLAGYTALEKKEIAKRYLIPRQLLENGLNETMVSFRVSAVNEIIDGYTMEAGVRELERVTARICRRITRKLVSGEWEENKKIVIDAKTVNELLGSRKYIKDLTATPQVGCATGMAWTSVGGVILPVETIRLAGGKGSLKLTGSLGKVMQESAEAAFTCIRSKAADKKVDAKFFTEHDFHIHVPDGATPKDGPSAGITIALALMSQVLNKPLIPRLAMTGEITLQGRITAIGGLREKLSGAIRSGIKTVIIPEENRKDAGELPKNIKDALQINFVKSLDEAIKIAFK